MQGCCSIWSFAKLRRDRCLLLRQDRCLLLRQDRYYKVFKHGCALSQQQTSVIQSCLHRRHRSCLSSRQLSCLNSRDASCLYRKHLSCLNKRHMTSVRDSVDRKHLSVLMHNMELSRHLPGNVLAVHESGPWTPTRPPFSHAQWRRCQKLRELPQKSMHFLCCLPN